jgi:hypothetical protein
VIKKRQLLRYLSVALCIASVAHAQARMKNPTSKLYVADIVGDTEIDTGTEVDELTKKSVYNAQGTTIETKSSSNASVVFSNGTGVYFDVDTRVEVKTFEQEAFRPNRSDVEDEPSISSMKLFIDHGVIGVSTSKLVAGSTVVCETSLATAFIHGRQAVILAEDNLTVISMIQGEASVQAGPLDHSHLVKNHQQIIIRPGKPGEENIVEIQDISEGATIDCEQWLEERVLTADSARKLVYFQTQARGGPGSGPGGGAGSGAGSASDGGISLFDGTGGGGGGDGGTDIVAVPVVPSVPPAQVNVSPANLSSP